MTREHHRPVSNSIPRHTGVRVLAVQLALIGFLLAFGDYLPWSALRILVAAAFVLPILALIAVITRPPVYRAWRTALKELYYSAGACLRTLRGCFSIRTFLNLWRFLASLKTFPSSPDEWLALSLFPFKVFVLTAPLFFWLCSQLARLTYARHLSTLFFATRFTVFGCFLCLGVLLLGALAQALFSKRGRSTQTVIVFVLAVAMLLGAMGGWMR